MGQWGKQRRFLRDGFVYGIIPHFDTSGAFDPITARSKINGLFLTHASGPNAGKILDELKRRLIGATAAEWQRAGLGDEMG